ncbi:MAG: phage protein Gp27 family protein [Lysobacteraceae bacterium]
MPPPSKIDLLPEEVRRELEEKIISNGFGGYVALSEWLAERGFEIGKSTLGVHGKKLERHIAAVKASTQAALALEEAARDDADARSNAIYAQFQSGIFDALMALDEAEDEADPVKKLALLTKAGKDFAAIGRGNLARQRWAAEVRAKLDAARQDVRRIAADAGVPDDVQAAIDARLMGVT